jgi:PST family polysaccharide transporter
VFSGFVLCGLALVGSVPIARLFHEPMAGAILAALSVRFIFAGGSATHIALLSRQLRFPALTTRTIGSVMVGGTVGVSLAYGGAGVWSLVGQALATYLSRAVLLWVVTSWRPKLLFSWEKARDLWHFGSRILGARIFTYTVKQFDNLLVGGTLGPAMLGYYAFAYGLFLSPLVDISLIVGRVTLSAFSRLQDDLERLKRGFMLTTTYVSFFAFPALIGFLLVTPDLVSVIFGSKWLPAVPVLRLLLVAGLLQSHTSIWATVFQAKNKPDWLLVLGFVSACTYVPAFFIGLRWGIAGVAGGYLASTVLLVPVQLILVQRLIRFRMREYLATFYPLLAASALMAGIVFVTQVWLTAQGVDAAVRLGASVVVGGVSYLGAVLLIRRELISRLVGILVGLRHSQAAMAEEAV